MRTIPPALAARLGGATTLARCWLLTRSDGVRLGFTDHDRDLLIEGVTCAALTGLEASETTAELGFAVGGGETVGVLSSLGLDEADIQRGRLDGATVEVWVADWAEPAARMLIDRYEIGEIRRGDLAFVAELRGLASRFDEERGRLYTARCSADLGDAHCGVVLAPVSATIGAVDPGGALTLSGLPTVDSGHFTGGRLVFAGGVNTGLAVEIASHEAAAGLHRLTLWLPLPAEPSPGDAVSLTPGCDKSFATCRTRFANALRFRGFPHMPGNDFVVQVAASDGRAVMDGGSLFR